MSLGIQDPNAVFSNIPTHIEIPRSVLLYPLDWIKRIDLIEGPEAAFLGHKDGSAIFSLTLKSGAELENCRLIGAVDLCRCGVSDRLPDPCGVLCSGIRDGESPSLDGSRLPHDALLEPDCQARRYGTGHRRVLHLRRTGRLRHLLSRASRRRGKSYSAGNGCCPNRLRIRSGRYPKRISPQRSGTFIGESVYLRLHPNPPARQCSK